MQQQETANVGNYMTRDPVSLSNTSNLQEAVENMAKKSIGNLVVTNGATVGILTEREILNYLNLFGKIPDKSLGDIMLRQFTKVSPETSIVDAAKKMIATKTRLLVYERDRLAGIITTSDLAKALYKTTNGNPPLDKVMSRTVVSLANYASILEAVKVMDKERIGSVIVTVEDLHDGIFTERDLLTKILTRNVDIAQEIGNYCSHFMLTARMGLGARDAAKLMFANGIKRLPITNNGRIVGMVTARDVVEAFTTEEQAENNDGVDPVC